MKTSRVVLLGITCALLGAFAQEGIAQAKKLTYTADLLTGKSNNERAAILLDGATELAGSGSWELIAVGRAWYLGGNKEKGQALFDRVTSSKKVETSDWLRVGAVYIEAHEADKAKAAFDHAMLLTDADNKLAAQVGAMLISLGDAAKGEELFNKSMAKHPKEFWGWVAAGGAYLGVTPML